MENKAQLKKQLKTLKLSGIIDNLDLRLLEAQQNQLGFSEFLSILLNDEMETRNQRKLKRLLEQAGMGSEKILETFDFSFNPFINAAYIRELATCRFIEQGEGVFFIGPSGTGKTHLAKALCHQACRRFFTARFYTFDDFLNELERAELQDRVHYFMKKLIKMDLLIIDDFAFKKIDQKTAEYLYSIVDARYAVKSMIFTSNRAISDWISIFPDPLMASAILDRIAHHSHQIVIEGESYRKNLAPKFANA